MKLWGGRFQGKLDPAAWELNASIHFDKRLAFQDIRGSMAWAAGLRDAKLLNSDEFQAIHDGLEVVKNEFDDSVFEIQPHDEDIHTAVERRLGELIGPLAGKLHTGRSRNDQVATDFRLWLLDMIPQLESAIVELQIALLARADEDLHIILPGYTHLQRAQPILLSHWWLSHFWPLQRDRERLFHTAQNTSYCPLGSAALAGTSFPIDRIRLSQELGFSQITNNSIDAVSDRDFVAEFLFCTALIGVHLSRLAEAVIIFSSSEFSYFILPDEYTTGSSLMPQKKNPDIFELARGRSGSLVGQLTTLLVTLKGLPSAYDKDLQEDKLPVFTAYDTLRNILPVVANAIRSISPHTEKMRAAISSDMMATDLADELVRRGIPFRDAHKMVGKAVAHAEKTGKTLDELDSSEFLGISPNFDFDIPSIFDPLRSIRQHNVIGGSAPEAVRHQIQIAKQIINTTRNQ